MQPFSEDSAVGTETSVPHRSLMSPQNLWNKASHQGGKGNHEAPRPGRPRPELSQARPRAFLGLGRARAVSGDRSWISGTQQRSQRWDTRATLDCTPARSRVLPLQPLQGFGSRPSSSPAALPHPHRRMPLCGRRQQPDASHLPREFDTWKRRIPTCDRGPSGARGTTSPRKPRVGHAHCLFLLPALVPGPRPVPRQRRAPGGGTLFSIVL